MKKAFQFILMGFLVVGLVSCENSVAAPTSSTETVSSGVTSPVLSSSSNTSALEKMENQLDGITLIPSPLDENSISISCIYEGSLDDLKLFYKNLGVTGTETDKAPNGTDVSRSGNPFWQIAGTYKGRNVTISADDSGFACNVRINDISAVPTSSTGMISSGETSSVLSSSSNESALENTKNQVVGVALIPSPLYDDTLSINCIYKGNLDDLKLFYKNLGVTGTETDKAPEGSGASMSGEPYWQIDGTYKGHNVTISADDSGFGCGVLIDVFPDGSAAK